MESLLERNYEGVKQFIFFKTALYIVDLMIWGYYGILLFRQTDSIRIISLNFLLFYIFIWIGYICSSFFLDKLGYLVIFRITFFLQALVLIAMIAFLPDINKYFLIFSSLKGFSRGIFWIAHNTFYLKEIYPKERSELINVTQGISSLVNVVIPIMAGALISYSESYTYIFFVAMVFCLAVAIVPFKYNIKSNCSVNSWEFMRILKKPLFWKLAFISFIDNGAGQTLGMLMSFVPFYIIGSEIGVGALISFAGIIAAIIAYSERKNTIKRKINIGYVSWIFYFIVYLGVGLFWNTIALVMRSLYITFVAATGDPIKIDLDMRTREKILGDFKLESAIEMNILLETVYLVARVVSILIFIFILDASKDSGIIVARIALPILSLIMLLAFHLFVRVSKHRIF